MRRELVTALAAGLVLGACGGAGNLTIEPGGDGAGERGDDRLAEQAAIAPVCDELTELAYDPPPEEQPTPDGSLTDAEPHPDIDPIDEDGASDPIGALTQWADRDAAEHFAGLWLDNDHGATVVAFTDDVDAYAEQVRERFGAGWWVVEAERSQAELFEVQAELNEGMESYWSEGGTAAPGAVYSSGIDVRKGRVTVGIMEPDEARLEELSERHGTDVICFEIEQLPTEADAQPAPWEPDPGADLSASSTSIDVLVNEVGCASGESADGRIAEPEVVYEPDRVVVTIRVVPVAGAAACPSNPDTPYTLELDEPLGDRGLLDGSHDPPVEPSLDEHR
ncbi:MAG: hypothetical protein EA340_10000 [Nitriliruptor sp.]|nr:MAG: hypothetical protein EA340_10000 [Nitriliruptor sp.]